MHIRAARAVADNPRMPDLRRVDFLAVALELIPLVPIAAFIAFFWRDPWSGWWQTTFWLSLAAGFGWWRLGPRWGLAGCAYGIARVIAIFALFVVLLGLALDEFSDSYDPDQSDSNAIIFFIALITWLAVIFVAPVVSAVLVGFMSARRAAMEVEGTARWQQIDAPP
jgi:hypothetical protein